NLAREYSALGPHAEAVKLFEETVAVMKAKLGPDHPTTLISMGNLAACWVAANRSSEAVPVIDDCIKRAAGKVLHPTTVPMVMDLRLPPLEKSKGSAGCPAAGGGWEKLKRS